MRKKAHGQIRRSQAVTTWGPGALLDLPRYSAIVGGLDTWPKVSGLDEITEPRLCRKLEGMTGVVAPRLYAPPASPDDPRAPNLGIRIWRFPEWFVVQEKNGGGERQRSRRLVHRKFLDDKSRFEGLQVVPTRFVRACPKGHIDDLDWRRFVHGPEDTCKAQLWLDERGTSGDLSDLVVRCECKRSERLDVATHRELVPLGYCNGERPWLGRNAREECKQPFRLLIRTATNAYFSQVVSVLSIPEKDTAVKAAVRELWEFLQAVDSVESLSVFQRLPKVASPLEAFADDEVLEAIDEIRSGKGEDKPVKQLELDAILAAPEGFGDDVPIDRDFHARRLPEAAWRRTGSPRTATNGRLSDGIEAVVQLHRLREVLALTGFTRFEAVTPDIQGEYETDVERALLALEPSWFPAIDNRGEGVFLKLRGDAVKAWLARPAVAARLDLLAKGHEYWLEGRKSKREFPGGPYVLLHTLSHLLIQSLAMRCGYPASSIRERIYSDAEAGRFGILLYTGSPDAEGTLGGLVQQGRQLESHLSDALRAGALCSNDPICAQHEPGESMEKGWLHGAACHGCALVAETSCEMRNDYLDRALVVPTLATADAAYFGDSR